MLSVFKYSIPVQDYIRLIFERDEEIFEQIYPLEGGK